jgi:hypothetical protein
MEITSQMECLRDHPNSITNDLFLTLNLWNFGWCSGVWINVRHHTLTEEKMIDRKAFTVLGLGLALAFLVLPDARASEIDQATKLTFSQSVQIPGQVLRAGTYWFTVDPTPGSKIVRIFSQDRLTLYATLQTVSAQYLEPSKETEITFADRGSMQPEAIVTWFYPGRTIGHEFLYSKNYQKEIAQAKQHTVAAGE